MSLRADQLSDTYGRDGKLGGELIDTRRTTGGGCIPEHKVRTREE
jgi:hypothetical protein